jgi:hypothetical protein
VDLLGTTAGIGAPALWGVFTVHAVGLGQTSYAFASDDGLGNPWSAALLTSGDPPLVSLEDSDCSDGACNVTGSVDPLLAVIEVVDEQVVARSPDGDGDGDVDVADYAIIQDCASKPTPLGPACLRVDLDWNGAVTPSDLALFTDAMTGATPPKGDLDNDGDVDLADFAHFQICRAQADEPELVQFCAFADINRDGVLDDLDIVEFVDLLTGPAVSTSKARIRGTPDAVSRGM